MPGPSAQAQGFQWGVRGLGTLLLAPFPRSSSSGAAVGEADRRAIEGPLGFLVSAGDPFWATAGTAG